MGLGICLAVALVGQTLYLTTGRNPYIYRGGMLFGLGTIWFQGVLVAVYGRELIARRWVRRIVMIWPALVVGSIFWKAARLPPQGIYLISGAAFTLMMLDFLRSPRLDPPADLGPLRRGLVQTLGLASYPMYLFHGPLLMLAGSWIMRTHAIADWRVTWALLTALGIASGVGLGWCLERPVMRWRASYLRRLK